MRGHGLPEGDRIADPVSTPDPASTFYDWAGVDLPEGIESRSPAPVIDGHEARIRV